MAWSEEVTPTIPYRTPTSCTGKDAGDSIHSFLPVTYTILFEEWNLRWPFDWWRKFWHDAPTSSLNTGKTYAGVTEVRFGSIDDPIRLWWQTEELLLNLMKM